VFRRLKLLPLFVVALVGCGQSTPPTGPDSTPAPELKWARTVAETFLSDVLSAGGDRYREGMNNCTEAFRRRYNSEGVFLETPELSGSKDHPASWAITSEELSPNGDEAIFNGTITSRRQGTFSIRVVQEKEAGRWRVDYFSSRYK
jgi:hypothetical protein